MSKKKVVEPVVKYGEDEDFDEEWNKAKTQQKGRWNEIFANLEKEGGTVRLTGLTEGQIGALYRKTKKAGYQIRTIEKRSGVIIKTS